MTSNRFGYTLVNTSPPQHLPRCFSPREKKLGGPKVGGQPTPKGVTQMPNKQDHTNCTRSGCYQKYRELTSLEQRRTRTYWQSVIGRQRKTCKEITI